MLVRFVRVPHQDTEPVRIELDAKDQVLRGVRFLHEDDDVLIPVTCDVPGMQMVERDVEVVHRPRSLSEALEGVLTDEQMAQLRTSFDVVGDIAVVEVPEGLEDMEGTIGEALLSVIRGVRVVCRKVGPTAGEFRVRPVRVIAGEQRTTTVYREHGCSYELDLARVYFSPRLATERARVASLVHPGETVMGMFAGVGPFTILTARIQPAVKRVWSVELNPEAVAYMKRNIKRNRVTGTVLAVQGDVREVVPALGRADRVFMPLPKGAHAFLDVAMAAAADDAIIHFYHFTPEDVRFEEGAALIQAAAEKAGMGGEVVFQRQVRSFSPGICQVVVDFRVAHNAP